MANEQQYFNPIIQAMMGSAQLQQGAAQQGIEKERNKNEAEARKQQLAQSLKQIEYEHEHQTGMLDLQGKQHQLTAEVAKLQAILQMNQGAGQGLKIGPVLDSLQGGQTPGGPNLTQGLTPAAFATPEERMKQAEAMSQAQAQGQMNVTLPAQKDIMSQEQKNKLELQNNENQFKQKLQESEIGSKEKIAGIDTASREKIAGLDRSTQLFIAQAHNATQLQMSGMGDPNTIKAGINAALTGRINNLDGSSPYERAILNGVQAVGGKPISTKELDVLRQSQQLMPLFNKLEDFAKKDLPNNKLGAFVQGHALGAAKSVGWSPDTQNEINMLSSQAINIGRALEGMTGGRVLASQMQLDLNAFASGGITRDQMLDRINNLKDYYVNKVDNMYLMGAPVEQRALLYKQQGIMPGFISVAPKTNKAGHKLDIEESIKRGQPIYSD